MLLRVIMDTHGLHSTDRSLKAWINTIAEASEGEGGFPHVSILEECIYINVVNTEIAYTALEQWRRIFPNVPNNKLKIFVREKLFFPPPRNPKKYVETKRMIVQTQGTGIAMFDNWGNRPQNQRFWKAIEAETRTNTVSVYSADPESGYRCLAIAPYLGLGNGGSRILAINASDQMGKPVILQQSDVPTAEQDALERSQFIGFKKLELIKQVRESAQIFSTSYSLEWAPPGKTPRTWTKQLVGIPLLDEKGTVTEVVVRTLSNAGDQAYWQAVADLS